MRRHLSYANLMATLARFFALGGGAYAATKLPRNSVTSTQIKSGSIAGADIEDKEDCSARGGHLPSWLQLTWVRKQADIAWAQGAGSNQYELTGEVNDPAAGVLTQVNG
ncbi:hypothetical protein DSM104299_02832 [Baekduia alba]|uniref:hypothetical protein n=1 Tax=Baekduia alba TaxID=2997333 RepID=UPI00233FC616|nr:hypothetical protein [Baekduia alba]WCB94104.1 hypothetical protein DSM104299_02832 [Baekduia alba]